MTTIHNPIILIQVDIGSGDFIWDAQKELMNIRKHGVDFATAAQTFLDPRRKIYADSKHSAAEERFFCMGKVGNKVMTVRYVRRHGKIRIFGAGYWRRGAEYYEKED